MPFVGVIVLFQYDSIGHAGELVALEETGFWDKESNFVPCAAGKRFVRWDDSHIKGFLNPYIQARLYVPLNSTWGVINSPTAGNKETQKPPSVPNGIAVMGA